MSGADRSGGMPEWALAMGLSLRAAAGPFVPADGTPRDAQVAAAGSEERPEAPAAAAQVVDLNQAVRDAASLSDSRLGVQAREAAHA
jgi:hypothetical protein